jgi:Holliday junction resolvasome RuvABC endonuclease subunit
MKIGIRCWPDKFAFAVADGSVDHPQLLEANVVRFPSGLKRPGFLHWISDELKGILRRHHIDRAAFKAIETTAQKNVSLLRRAEVEGVVQAVIYEAGCHNVTGLNKQQLKSRIKLNDKASELSQAVKDSGLLTGLAKDCEDAVLVAWALLGD